MAGTPEFPCYIPTNTTRVCIMPDGQPYACGKCVHGDAAAAVLEARTRMAVPQAVVHVETTTGTQFVIADGYLMATVFQGLVKDAANQLIRLISASFPAEGTA